ncbi:MAG: MoxR family ATPase [Phycisphaerae bacterium]|nr:MAG: MoxR family ATPase [Planctomycetota bacterium]KAB2949423.1 MAG: MoxR family ATPase [Phycisphaerae bacterium]MBE7458368.1 MoxR family ATPase [Planctomycetia bacterium]MCK6465183.1 AAA family ATPase [Phycisphaerae bacterium]MCL4718823.1 MoxR family ATPase [Phycisphaerae bacterium]
MQNDVEAVEALRSGYARLRAEMGKVIVGQDDVLEQLFIALFAGGHCILEGVPGLAKTLMISTLARCLDLRFNRIQFTPDLMPSDITGTEVIQEDKASGTRMFKFLPGPVFTNVLLADEINRTPPKTQAALLEAMQERHVTVGGERHDLPGVFFVLATQNPIEQEGTYPLPEAQQDRFLFKINVGYPPYDEELAIAERTTAGAAPEVARVFDGAAITGFQPVVRRVPAAPDVLHYALRLVRATRPEDESAPAIVRSMITWGAGPRAVQGLILAGKARAVIHGRSHVAVEDLSASAPAVLRHRLVLNYSAEAEGYSPDRMIEELIEYVDPHATGPGSNERFQKVLST